MNAHTRKTSAGEASERAIPAGVRKIPTPTVPPTTRAAAAPRADAPLQPGGVPGAQNVALRPSWKARGPPEPKTPPAVVSAWPKDEERR